MEYDLRIQNYQTRPLLASKFLTGVPCISFNAREQIDDADGIRQNRLTVLIDNILIYLYIFPSLLKF
jgi:hypothetical protein